MAEDIVKRLSRPGSTVILVFLTPSAGTQFQGETPSVRAQHTRGWKNFAISIEIAIYLGKVRNRPMVAMER